MSRLHDDMLQFCCGRLTHHVLDCHRNKLDGPYDNRLLPIVLSVVMITALSITFVSSLMSL